MLHMVAFSEADSVIRILLEQPLWSNNAKWVFLRGVMVETTYYEGRFREKFFASQIRKI